MAFFSTLAWFFSTVFHGVSTLFQACSTFFFPHFFLMFVVLFSIFFQVSPPFFNRASSLFSRPFLLNIFSTIWGSLLLNVFYYFFSLFKQALGKDQLWEIITVLYKKSHFFFETHTPDKKVGTQVWFSDGEVVSLPSAFQEGVLVRRVRRLEHFWAVQTRFLTSRCGEFFWCQNLGKEDFFAAMSRRPVM